MSWVVGQFGTGQFGTGQFGTRTIWHQDYLAPGQFGTRTISHRTIWHQEKKVKKNAFFCNFSQNQVPYFFGNVAFFEVFLSNIISIVAND